MTLAANELMELCWPPNLPRAHSPAPDRSGPSAGTAGLQRSGPCCKHQLALIGQEGQHSEPWQVSFFSHLEIQKCVRWMRLPAGCFLGMELLFEQ